MDTEERKLLLELARLVGELMEEAAEQAQPADMEGRVMELSQETLEEMFEAYTDWVCFLQKKKTPFGH